ncbi:MAG: alpha-amylase [Candidatus Eisenbacteria bacterium]|nr:alpha-amylase [Candidatus Eisenbacteria bacterium]
MSRLPSFEFHVARAARERYGFDDTLFALTGNVVFANLAAARAFAQKMNAARDLEQQPERAVQAGALNAMGLIDEALHLVVAAFRAQRDPRAITDALAWFERRLGRDALDRTLLGFAGSFPTVAVHRGRLTARAWLAGESGGTPHRAVALEELMMLWLANANPAFKPFAELFDDRDLARLTAYPGITRALRDYFETRPRFGPDQQNLVDLLRAPALAAPDSLSGQLAFIRERWGLLLGDLMARFLTALDVLKEEELAVWLRYHPPAFHAPGALAVGDSGPGAILRFDAHEHEHERFSADLDWMPNVVLIAKSVYVWLDQLSRRHQRAITRLDQIPDEELDTLRRRGFTGLWLIGVWERSRASQRVKQLTGNPEAVASAYSLLDYAIAADLGGEAAYAGLRERAWARGIRLASDMVPNHMGVDSRWVIEHPDWFLSLDHSPFPAYSFNGPDLSSDGRVAVQIEDHYYDRSDAAVVFRRTDRWTGDQRWIYHGNDGTSMPWNDTAQLDYLKPAVREAVIQTILAVARRFPIIRFDAAMTLAKRHYQRLWFPEPGGGGAIPTRAEHGLTKAQFDAAMPVEFWREVVDRVAAEAPDTLLLAEAFWLMEGYFVRTLGMHRVYNSAFMNMLRDEQNANYRLVIRNTLEFDPEVLKRYVSFMNNPDERTAVDQFGRGDKYFGICTLMVTLPGLPMFGHGQVEGLAEKYGMEYRRAYHDERPDPWMVERHERQIAPLLHRRALFAEARDFLLYDFHTESGHVNEDVFAYSNGRGGERALVAYHNRYATTRGWIRLSCAYAEKTPGGGKALKRRALDEALGLAADPALFVRCRDAVSGLEHLWSASELAERGLHLELDAYRCLVFLDWQEVRDDGIRPWARLAHELAGRGVPSLDASLLSLELRPVHRALRLLLAPAAARALAETAAAPEPAAPAEAVLDDLEDRARTLRAEARRFSVCGGAFAAGLGGEAGWHGEEAVAARALRLVLQAALRLPALEALGAAPWSEEARAVLPSSSLAPAPAEAVWGALLAWATLLALGRLRDPEQPERAAVELFDALHLRGVLASAFEVLGLRGEERWRAAARARASFAHHEWQPAAAAAHEEAGVSAAPRAEETSAAAREEESARSAVVGVRADETAAGAGPGPAVAHAAARPAWLDDADVLWLIGAHEHEGVQYVVREPYECTLWWMSLRALLRNAAQPRPDAGALRAIERGIAARLAEAEAGGWRLEALQGVEVRSAPDDAAVTPTARRDD